MAFSPLLVRPNLPLRKPSSSPMAPCAASPSSVRPALLSSSDFSTPVRPTLFSHVGGGFLSPGIPATSPINSENTIMCSLTPTPNANLCNFCSKQGTCRCKRCKKTVYCSVVCQKEDWKAHRHMCKAAEAEPAIEKILDSSFSPPSENKQSPDHSDATSIQRVYMKDLPTKVIKGTEIQAAVVEFNSPGRFFIVAQSTDILEALQSITTELQKSYSVPTALLHAPAVEEVCAVQYSCDMNWYRGLIQSVAADKNTAHVLYIDFGNEEEVPFVRIKPLTAQLQQFSPCAIECCLTEVVPVAEAWSGKCCMTVWQLLEGKTVAVKVTNTSENGRIQDIDIVLSNGNTLSSFLLDGEYATKKAINKAPTEQDITALVSASLDNYKRCSIGKDDNSWAQVPEPLTQAVGDSFLVVVTHFQAPEKIVVQKVDNARVVQELQLKLRDHCNQLPESSNFRPAPGTVCCALFSEDKQWYRTKILAYSSEDRVCVGYLDFGNSEDVELSNLRPITQSLLDIPMQAMTCGLGVEPTGESWSEECLLALQKRFCNRMLRAVIHGPQEGKALVSLIDEASDPQANIAELLISAGYAVAAVASGNNDESIETPLPAPELPVCSPPPVLEPLVWTSAEIFTDGQSVVLRACCVESPGKFFCHIDNPKDIELLIALEEELMPYFEAETSTYDPKVGEPCCAIVPEHGKYFRALVKEVCEDEAVVALADYGYCLSVKKSNLKCITAKYLSLPFLAVPCWLAGVEPLGSEWSSEALLWFQSLVEEETLSARVLSVTEDGYGVELQSKGHSVAAALLSENMAKLPGERGKQEITVIPNTQNESVLESSPEKMPNNPGPAPTQNDSQPSQAEETFPLDWNTVMLPVNETFQPCIAAASNPALFYVIGPKQVGEEQLKEMMLQLAAYCYSRRSQASALVAHKPAVGAACCARFSADSNWYRAVILEMCGDVASVIYVDYGNSEKVPLSDILPITDSLLQLPFQVTRCTLAGKESFPAQWSEALLKVFISALQQEVVATVQAFDGYANVLSLSLPPASGGGLVEAMVLRAHQAEYLISSKRDHVQLEHSSSAPAPVAAPVLIPVGVPAEPPAPAPVPEPTVPSRVPNGATTMMSPEPCAPPETTDTCGEAAPTPEAPPQKPVPLGKSTEAEMEDPVQRILKHMEPPCITDPKTRDALASSCCCQSLKNKIDQLEQMMQVQLSLTKKLMALK